MKLKQYSHFLHHVLSAAVVIAVALFLLPINTIPQKITVEMTDDNITDPLQLYYDIGSGFNERNSIVFKRKTLKKSKIEWTFVPRKKIQRFRLDPVKKSGLRKLKTITISIYGNSYQFTADDILSGFTPVNNIKAVNISGVETQFVASGEDPYLFSTFDMDKVYHEIEKGNIRYWVAYCLEKGFMGFSLCLLYFVLMQIRLFPTDNRLRPFFRFTNGNFTYSLIVAWCVLWFVLQATYYAANVDYGVFPDERAWVEISQCYAVSDGFRLENSEKTYHLGSVTTIPYLYFLIAGKVLSFGEESLKGLLYNLRFFSILCAFATIVITYLLTKLITSNRFVSLAVLICLSNLPMFVFISAAASYDPWVNLLAVLTSYLSVLYFKTRKYIYVSASFVCLLVGALSKITFLPFILVQVIITTGSSVYFFWKDRRFLAESKTVGSVITTLFLLLFLGLNLELYGANLLNYGAIRPSHESVLGKDIARTHHAITKRNYLYSLTKTERKEIGVTEYIPKWLRVIEGRTLGIFGHESIYKPVNQIFGYRFLLVLSVLGVILNFRQVLNNSAVFYLFVISVSYAAFLFWFNYDFQTKLRVMGLAIQGRYLFPIIPQLLIVLFFCLLKRFSPTVSVGVVVLLLLVGLHGGLNYFLLHGGDAFFNHKVSF